MWHDTKEIVSEPRTVPCCFSLYYLDHSHNPSNTSCDLCAPGELGEGRLPYRRVCICVVHDKHCRLDDVRDKLISLLWQYIFEKSPWSARARSPAMQQYEQNQVWTALEPDIASETAVLLSRSPQPLLEHPPKRTAFYVLLRRRKLSACV